jgi:hypothetical protein
LYVILQCVTPKTLPQNVPDRKAADGINNGFDTNVVERGEKRFLDITGKEGKEKYHPGPEYDITSVAEWNQHKGDVAHHKTHKQDYAPKLCRGAVELVEEYPPARDTYRPSGDFKKHDWM